MTTETAKRAYRRRIVGQQWVTLDGHDYRVAMVAGAVVVRRKHSRRPVRVALVDILSEHGLGQRLLPLA